MTQEEFLLLNELITGQIGICFPQHKKDLLESRLRPRLQALRLPRFLDYYLELQCDQNGERSRLPELVTNNETFFFRETRQFEALFEQGVALLAPGLALPGTLRVLCAGCSSGEEPYTLSICARQHLLALGGTGLSIDAFDVDAARVEQARQAVYGPVSFRSTTPEQLAQYFTPTGAQSWTLKALYRSNLHLAGGNIVDLPSFAKPFAYDALFCRNVMIYFAEPALHRAVRNFAQVLRPGGLLFLGAAESIIGLSDRFETVRLGSVIAYRKVGR